MFLWTWERIWMDSLCLILMASVLMAGPGGSTSKMTPSRVPLMPMCLFPCLSTCWLIFQGPLWRLELVTAQQSQGGHFLCGSWFPRGRKWNLSGQLRALPVTGTVSLPPYFMSWGTTGPTSWWQRYVAQEHGDGRYCCCHLCKVCSATASGSFPLSGEKAWF